MIDDWQVKTSVRNSSGNYINTLVNKMASIAMMIGGAVLNAAAFTGGNYFAKFLAGDGGQAALDKNTRHDKALEAYQAAMRKYTREHTQILNWINTNEEIKEHVQKTSQTLITHSSSITTLTQTRD